MNIDTLVQQLGSVPHFRGLSQQERERLILSGHIRACRPDELILLEGASGDGLCVLLSGRVRLTKLGQQGQNAILAVFDPVIMFNEVAALDGGPNAASVEAVEHSIIWQLSAQHVETLLRSSPDLSIALLRVLAARNRRLVAHFASLSFCTVQARAARLLLELSARGARPIDRRRHPNHQMAAQIATGPEAFSRALRALRQSGDIATTRTAIDVLCPDGLARLAEITPLD